MAEKILMPKLSDTMEEGVIAAWHKEVGDTIESGDLLAEIETDKATMEYEEYTEGVLLYRVDAQSTVPVDGLIAIVGEKGEDFQALLSGGDASTAPAETPAASEPAPASPATATQTAPAPAATASVDVSSIPATVVTMPKLSDTMEEGGIAEWHKKVGEPVEVGDILVEIETDKATMEFEAYDEGTLLYIAADQGQSLAVDALLCIIGEEGADYQALIQNFNSGGTPASPADTPAPTESGASNGQTSSSPATSSTTSNGRIKISPLAKIMAEDKGYDLSAIPGTGDGGRIVKRDVEAFVPGPKKETPAPAEKSKPAQSSSSPATPSSEGYAIGQESYEEIPLSQMRKTIARRLGESKFTAPHFYLTMEIIMDEAMETRKKLNEMSPVKISFNDMVVKAAAVALRQHPAVNSSWRGDKIIQNHHVHVGVAVAVPEGLLVPVVRFADAKSLSQIAANTKELAGKAKDKKLQPSEWEGNTFSISNLGMFGIEEFTAIINPPDSCIMAVGTIKQTAVPVDGELKLGHVMKVTLSCDHRVVDGASGAAFLQTFKSLMESPIRMLV